MKIYNTSLFLLLLIPLFSCREDFVYITEYQTPQDIHRTVNIKNVTGNSKLDVIIAIDNSSSMGDEQNAIRVNGDKFITSFTARRSSLDWKMGLISTDEKQDPFLGFRVPFNVKTPNPISMFRRQVAQFGTGGSTTEKVFFNVLRHLDDYPSFLRAGAFLAVIAVTDSPDHSSISAPYVFQELEALKGSPSLFKYYGAFGAEDFGCKSDGLTLKGSKHEDLLRLTHGAGYHNAYFSVCSDDFGTAFAQIGDTILQEALYPKIRLNSRPDTDTLAVSYHGIELPGGNEQDGGKWYYDYTINSIVFYSLDFAEGTQENVDISYTEDFLYYED